MTPSDIPQFRRMMATHSAFEGMRAERLTGKSFDVGEVARELDQSMLAFAPFLDQMVREPRTFASLQVEHTHQRIDVLGRVELQIRLRNELGVGGIPLAVGTDRPINSRLLLSPRYQTAVTELGRLMRPEVVRLDRRLRLKPGESINVTYWGTRATLLQLMEGSITSPGTLRWRAVQGFEMSDEGRYEPGPLCLGADSDILTREKLEMPSTAGALADQLAIAEGPWLLKSFLIYGRALRLTQSVIDAARRQEPPEEPPAQVVQEQQILVASLLQKLGQVSSLERAYALQRTRFARWITGPIVDEVLDLLKDERDPSLWASMLFVLADQPTPRVFEMAESIGDEDVTAVVNLLRQIASTMGTDDQPSAPPAPPASDSPGAAPSPVSSGAESPASP
jgi:hypothetical protein